MILRSGDIGFTHGFSLASHAIRVFQRTRGESKSLANHTFVVVDGGPLDKCVIVEAKRRVERGRLLDAYGGGSDGVAIFRDTRLTPEERTSLAAAADRYVGRSYGYLKLAAHLGDWALEMASGRHAYLFRRMARMDSYPICSWVLAYAYAGIGKGFGVPPWAAQPDDIWDWIARHREIYNCVKALGPLTHGG